MTIQSKIVQKTFNNEMPENFRCEMEIRFLNTRHHKHAFDVIHLISPYFLEWARISLKFAPIISVIDADLAISVTIHTIWIENTSIREAIERAEISYAEIVDLGGIASGFLDWRVRSI